MNFKDSISKILKSSAAGAKVLMLLFLRPATKTYVEKFTSRDSQDIYESNTPTEKRDLEFQSHLMNPLLPALAKFFPLKQHRCFMCV